MGYDKMVLARARKRYSEELEEFRSEQRAHLQEVYENIPRIAELDRSIRGAMTNAMIEAFREGKRSGTAMENARERVESMQAEREEILAEAGYAEDYLVDGPRCRSCSDTGYVGTQMCSCFQKICEEEERRELTQLFGTQQCDFDDFNLDFYPTETDRATGLSPRTQMEMVYDICVTFASRFTLNSKNLFMNGGTGLGKTFLSACIASCVVSKGYSVVYDSAANIFGAMERIKFGNRTENDQQMADRVMACDLLILDDLGTEMQSAFITSALYNIVNTRLMENHPTIISTNLKLGDIQHRYSQQIASRIMGEYINLLFLGKDIRLMKNPQNNM